LNILVTGSKGQLGSELQFLSASNQHEFIFTDSVDLDITKWTELKSFFQQHAVDVILNCAAYTAVDKAEKEKEKAYAINEDGVSHLVNICEEFDVKLIHFSTDYVFDGSKVTPYKETDEVNPQGIYGKSKRAGEGVILQSNVSALIIRTSWLYSVFGNNFVKTMLSLGQKRDSLSVVYDQVGTPTNARDLAKAALQCIENTYMWEGERKIYHFSNEGVTSWYDFAISIFKTHNINCKVSPILSKDYPVPAKRPHYSVFDKHNIKTDFKIEIDHWEASFQSCSFGI
jgi:dTDP-4-dehydrorhamnose reductase